MEGVEVKDKVTVLKEQIAQLEQANQKLKEDNEAHRQSIVSLKTIIIRFINGI